MFVAVEEFTAKKEDYLQFYHSKDAKRSAKEGTVVPVPDLCFVVMLMNILGLVESLCFTDSKSICGTSRVKVPRSVSM